jgi:hypothetical protein
MALKLSVGISRKVGMPDFGSVGASCSLEVEVDAGLQASDPAVLQARIRHAYEAVRLAVQDELARLQALPTHPHEAVSVPCDASLMRRDDRSCAEDSGNGSNTRPNRAASRRPATIHQLRAIAGIARRRRTDLSELLRTEFDVEGPEELSVRQASRLIDRLRVPAED